MINSSGLKTSTPAQLPKHGNFVIAGAAGVGKSAFAASVGAQGKVLIADPEQGSSTYHSAWFQAQPTSAKIENIHIINFDDVANVNQLVHRVEGALDYLIRTNNSDGYEAFVLDSLTEFQERFIRLHGAADPRQSYGALKEAVHGFTLKARQAPVITIFTARLRSVVDEVSQREMVRPEVSPGVWGVTSGLFDQIGLFDLRVQGVSAKRVLDFSVRPRFAGKDRFGIGALEEPTFVAMKERMLNSSQPKAASPTQPATRAPRR